MINFFDYFNDRLFDSEDQIAKGSGVLGGVFISIYLLFDNPELAMIFTWEFLIKSIFGIAISVITTMAVLIVTDLYKYAKPKTIKYVGDKFLIIKIKLLRNGKEKSSKTENENEKRA